MPEYDEQLHIIGKDIIKFHCIYWPAFLQAADIDPYKHKVLAHGHWTVDGRKMSKSVGNVVDPLYSQLADIIPYDGWRWFLLRKSMAELENSSFSNYQFGACIEKDLSGGIGTLMNRVCSKKMNPEQKWPKDPDFSIANFQHLISLTKASPQKYERFMLSFQMAKAVDVVAHLIKVCHKVCEAEGLHKCDNELHKNTGIAVIYEALRVVSLLCEPFIPEKANFIKNKLNIMTDIFHQEDLTTWKSLETYYPDAVRDKGLSPSRGLFFNRIQKLSIEEAKVDTTNNKAQFISMQQNHLRKWFSSNMNTGVKSNFNAQKGMAKNAALKKALRVEDSLKKNR